MQAASSADLKSVLHRLLDPGQVKELPSLQARCPTLPALVKELVARAWITSYQAKLLIGGQSSELFLGPYVLLECIGQGGFGQIFKARHLKMGRLVAVKMLNPGVLRDQDVVQRFYREIEVASQVSHPHIVHAYEAGPIAGRLVLVMEFVDGRDLEEMVRQAGPLPVAQACEYICQAALGLQYAHERGLIHRDIKPSNLLVSKIGGTIKILDLGLARLLEPVEGSTTSNLTVAGGQSLMQGSPDYMSPEQALDFHKADVRSDIYSLGCTFYFLLAGTPPFAGRTLAEKLMKHQQAEPPLDRLAGVSRSVQDILRKMLAKQPSDRYQVPAEVIEALLPFCKPDALAEATCAGSTATMESPTLFDNLTGRWRRPFFSLGSALQWRTIAIAGLMVLILCLALLFAVYLNGPSSATLFKATPTQPLPPRRLIDFADGFQVNKLKLNGSAAIGARKLRLTDAVGGQRGSAYFVDPVAIQSFRCEFTLQFTKAKADGITFVVQNQGLDALGTSGGSLGYQGINKSVAVKFDIYGAGGEDNSIGVFTNGASPGQPFKVLQGMSLKSGNPFRVRLSYDDQMLAVNVTDTVTGASHDERFGIDIPQTVGSSMAYVGFTGATGGATALQEILSWTLEVPPAGSLNHP